MRPTAGTLLQQFFVSLPLILAEDLLGALFGVLVGLSSPLVQGRHLLGILQQDILVAKLLFLGHEGLYGVVALLAKQATLFPVLLSQMPHRAGPDVPHLLGLFGRQIKSAGDPGVPTGRVFEAGPSHVGGHPRGERGAEAH